LTAAYDSPVRRAAVPLALAAIASAQLALFLRLRSTATDYDEGVYLLSVRALRAGEALGSDVFAAQPPGFYWLLRAIAGVLGDGVGDVRLGIAALSVAGVVGAWALARPLAGAFWALLPAALFAVAPPVPFYAVRVLSDLPALWLAVAGLGLAATATTRGGRSWPAAAGLALGAAVSVKLAAALVLPFAAVVLWERRRLAIAAAGAAVVWLMLLVVHAGALGDLWESAVVYHREARDTPAVVDRGDELRELFLARVPFTWLAVAGLVVLALRLARHRTSRIELAVWGWAAVGLAFLLEHEPLHENHLVWLPVPLALAAGTTLAAEGRRLGRWEPFAAAALAVVVAAGYVQQQRRAGGDDVPEPAGVVAAARLLDARTRPSDLVVTDVPAVAVLADRLVPGPLVDSARLRFETGTLTVGEVLDVIDDECVQAVVVGRSFPEQPGLVNGIAARFERRTAVGGLSLYDRRRRPCAT
jgi:4-amino-4-deoxy-L-arabinose transferase-like glycosyltransferase